MHIKPIILTSNNRNFRLQYETIIDQFGECDVYSDTEKLGAAQATQNALRQAHFSSQKSHILFMEDDIAVHGSVGNVIKNFIFPKNVGIVTFCDMREMPSHYPNGLYTKSALGCDNRGWWGNQAILIHNDLAHHLSTENWFSQKIENFPGVKAHAANWNDHGRNCSDIRMSLLVNDFVSRNLYAVYVPSLFRHIGNTSKCFPERQPFLGERETRNWIGNQL